MGLQNEISRSKDVLFPHPAATTKLSLFYKNRIHLQAKLFVDTATFHSTHIKK